MEMESVGNSSRPAPIDARTRARWDARITDRETPWKPIEWKQFGRLCASRPFDPIVTAWMDLVWSYGPYLIDEAFGQGRATWLRARHVRMDGEPRLGSRFGSHETARLDKALRAERPDWRLLGFYDAGTVLRDAVYPVLYLQDRETMEGVAFVVDGDLNILTSWRDTLVTGKSNWRARP
jgi:hypothetical protein